ncbi:Abnormal spindle-like microcephaly-associated protein ASH domain-containing protein [Paraburkholderia sacchari]|uniref:choice-of-anchor D domain-containing protein n=1 Tax=Paraburkholderia sacchari TaxID=159450 RepID=UPI0039A574A5
MSLNGTVWAPIGPSPINQGAITSNGQVTAIAVHPTNSNIVYIGTAWGGVWMRNGGAPWTPIFDRAPALGIGEPAGIAIDPVDPNIVYVGTSSRDGSQFSGEATQPPAGLFKSTDGGGSWVRLGSGYPSSAPSNASQFFNQIINIVIVDPANHLVVYLATNFGVFVSSDGGLNWTRGALSPGDVRSLVLDTTSPAGARILYAGVTGAGIFQSKDGGQTWAGILSGATPVVANELCPTPPCVPGRSVGKFIVALAPPISPPVASGIQVLYATMEGRPLNRPRLPTDAPDPVGVFRSTDQGLTWTLQTPTGSGIPPGFGMPLNTQGGYSFHMAVDPASPGDGSHDILYFGAVGQARSTDSGQTFTPLKGLHSDTHAWTFVPQTGPLSTVYCGNDGGIFRSTGGSTTFTSLNGDGLQTTLFYNLDVKRDPGASVTLGALQDNGIVTNAPPAVFPAWTDGVGGDGFDVAHDGQNATKVYGRSNANIFRSTNNGDSYSSISPPWPAAESNVYLSAVAVDPSTDGTVYAGSNANLWQSTDSGATWPKKVPIPGTANEVDVAPTNNNNVVVAVGGKVLVSTNANGAYTLTNITRDLPGRFVARVAFDPNDSATIYAVLGGFSGFAGGHVFRTTLADTTWTDISPPLDLPFNAIALDGSTTPATLYTGTDFGVLRSVDGGANWGVLDDLHFPRAPVFELVFHAGELRAATFGRGVFSFVKPAGPVIAVSLSGNLAFGTVCRGSTQYQTITVYNVGVKDLLITSVQRLMGSTDFTVLANPGTPLSLAPGEEIAFTIAFTPTGTPGFEAATIRIITNDPNAPAVDMLATALIGSGRVSTAIAQAGSFGNVCLGSKADQLLTINNRGTCPLSIANIVGSPEFLAPSVLSWPLRVGAGESIDVIARFEPTGLFGAKAGTITIVSDDPAGPHVVPVSGFVPAPKANLIIANTGSFGEVCVGAFADEALIVTNSGKCTLSVTGISSSSSEFLVPEVLSYPFAIGPGDALPVPIRFKPLSFGAKAATITVTSNDPASPISVAVSGEAPSGKLTVAGSTSFGGVSVGCCADRTVSICNTGHCALSVTSVHFRRRSRRWKLLNNPFPATLHPGSCLPVVIQYRAGEKCPRPCELVIESNDPAMPVKYVEVLAHTLWEDCDRDCHDRASDDDECHRDRCGKCPPCPQGYPCCDDDDDDDDSEGDQCR